MITVPPQIDLINQLADLTGPRIVGNVPMISQVSPVQFGLAPVYTKSEIDSMLGSALPPILASLGNSLNTILPNPLPNQTIGVANDGLSWQLRTPIWRDSTATAGNIAYATATNTIGFGSPDFANLVDKSSTQSIGGLKTWTQLATFSGGLNANTITSTGNLSAGSITLTSGGAFSNFLADTIQINNLGNAASVNSRLRLNTLGVAVEIRNPNADALALSVGGPASITGALGVISLTATGGQVISDTGFTSSGPIKFANSPANGLSTERYISGAAGANNLQYNVPSAGLHAFSGNGTTVFSISSAGAITANNAGLFGGGVTANVNNITTTSTDGLRTNNAQPASSGSQVQYTPRLRLGGSAWNTTSLASHTSEWKIEGQPAAGNPITSTLVFGHNVNGGGYTNAMTLTNGGIATFPGALILAPSATSNTGVRIDASGATNSVTFKTFDGFQYSNLVTSSLIDNGSKTQFVNGNFTLGSGRTITWGTTDTYNATPSVGLAYSSAGVLKVTDGSTGSGKITAINFGSWADSGTYLQFGSGSASMAVGSQASRMLWTATNVYTALPIAFTTNAGNPTTANTDLDFTRTATGTLQIGDFDAGNDLSLKFTRKSTTTPDKLMAQWDVSMPVAIDASYTSRLIGKVADFGSLTGREWIRADATGTAVQVGINGAVSGSNVLTVNGTPGDNVPMVGIINGGNTTFMVGLEAVAPNMTAGRALAFTFGKASSARNRAYFQYYHDSDGGTLNRADFGFHTTGTVMSLLASGRILITPPSLPTTPPQSQAD
jgi:hypothetical protein